MSTFLLFGIFSEHFFSFPQAILPNIFSCILFVEMLHFVYVFQSSYVWINGLQKMVDYSGYWKVCAVWVPWQLTIQLEFKRWWKFVPICWKCLKQLFFNLLVGDETSLYLYYLEMKLQFIKWHHTSSPRLKKFTSQ